MVRLKFPKDIGFFINLALQRTGSLVKSGGSQALSDWFHSGSTSSIARHLSNQVHLKLFLDDLIQGIKTEAVGMVKKLPENQFERIVSIGPGNGLLELLILKNTSAQKILLIDIEATGSHHHGYADQGSGYASLSATKNFLITNGLPESSVETCNPLKTALPQFHFNLCISILSMGFHYPCQDSYIDWILENSKPNAKLVLDKRQNVPDAGFERLKANFYVESTEDSGKASRVYLSRIT